MTLMATERMKLFSTRSPWFCSALTISLVVGFAGLLAATSDEPADVDLGLLLAGSQFGLMVVLVMGALAITTEYRFGTIRTTFQAMPSRTAVLGAKAGVVALVALVLGEVAGFGAWGVGKVFGVEAGLSSGADWRAVVGLGVVFALSAIAAVAVGALIRQSAGAISILLVWSLLLEDLVSLIPNVGDNIRDWMPFVSARRFLGNAGPDPVLGPWASLGYFAAITAVLFVIAAVVVNKRDA
ncbi:hypothetical protein ACOBQX_16340 [Actinokineospora sp. G85]|uniref:hypothetical protein n=1 Tax=Actinokineospora sp. G85 TaxID=3406626 RepID=UPI003C736966